MHDEVPSTDREENLIPTEPLHDAAGPPARKPTGRLRRWPTGGAVALVVSALLLSGTAFAHSDTASRPT